MMNQKLKNKLLEMAEEDQRMRERARDSGKWSQKIDVKNTEKLKKIIQKHGWPTISLVGKEGANAAWLITQHADHNIEFQKSCLALLKKAVKQGEASPSDLAYLQDRVLVNTGKKQVYGTQFQQKDDKLVPYPIVEPKNLDKRRREMNLSPFEEYRKQISQDYKKFRKG